jgi:hypothetical protein
MSPMTRAAWAVVALLAAHGCGGEVGTISIALVAAPDSDLLDRVQRVRAVLSDPPTEVEAERDGDGELSLDIEIAAQSGSAILTVEGFDGDGQRIALGRSAPLPVGAVNAAVTLYMGPPLGFAAAPVALDPPRSEIGAGLLPYGAILVGGRDASGAPVDDTVIYNVYDHAFQVGEPLPQARAAATVVSGEAALVYVFGGLDSAGAASGTAWGFNTSVAPAGLYIELTTEGEVARAGAAGVFVGSETVLITGAPAVLVDGLNGRVAAWPDAPPLADGAAARLTADAPSALIAGLGVGDTGAVSFADGEYAALPASDEVRRTGHAVVALPDGRALVAGGALESSPPERSAVIYDPDSGQLGVVDEFLATGRTDAAFTATSTYVLAAGGVDAEGAILADAELFDATTLDPVATLPLVVPRRGASALPLANGQVLVVGGVGEDGMPVAAMELFTPDR